MTAHLDRLLTRRDELAEASTRALAHAAPDADVLGATLGDIEAAIEETDVATFDRCLGRWLEEDQARLQAHVTGQADNCIACSMTSRHAHVS